MPMTSSRKERNRRAILDAARQVLAERGFHGTSLEEVAQAAGLTRRTVYSHFESKGDLLVALVDHVYASEIPEDLVKKTWNAADARAALDAAVDVNAAYLPKIRDFARVIRGARVSEPTAEAAYQHRMEGRRIASRRLAARLAKEGVLAPGIGEPVANDLIWVLLSIDVYELLIVESGWDLERYRRYVKHLLASALISPGLRASGGSGPSEPH
jgi:AcrR family transcriptional regulator